MDLPEAPSPTEVELNREHGLLVRWPDGSEARFTLDELRRNCPCAECRGLREQGHEPGTANPRAVGAELVGAWGVLLRWDDGHETGIFAWSILRAWAGLDDLA
jgi:DUF971 family protein